MCKVLRITVATATVGIAALSLTVPAQAGNGSAIGAASRMRMIPLHVTDPAGCISPSMVLRGMQSALLAGLDAI